MTLEGKYRSDSYPRRDRKHQKRSESDNAKVMKYSNRVRFFEIKLKNEIRASSVQIDTRDVTDREKKDRSIFARLQTSEIFRYSVYLSFFFFLARSSDSTSIQWNSVQNITVH